MIILNERKEAEKIIESGNIGNKPSETLGLLARYYYSEGLSGKELYKKLNDFMQTNFPKYNPDAWKSAINSKVKKASKYSLVEISDISITQAEIEIIQSLGSLPLERLAFTLLCLAKFGNQRCENNNGWVCRSDKEIFKLANVSATVQKQAEMLNTLYRSGLIGFSMKITNTNLQVLYIHDDSDEALRVFDFRELGLEYMNYIGKHKYIRCNECGRLIKCVKNARTKYCKDCAAKVNIIKTYENRKKNSQKV